MDIKVGRNWGLFAAGIALVIIGFVLLMVPGLTLVSIAVIAGCMFLAAGIVDAYAYFTYRGPRRSGARSSTTVTSTTPWTPPPSRTRPSTRSCGSCAR